jgi:hypothetical protein
MQLDPRIGEMEDEPQDWTPEYVAKMFETGFPGDTVKLICDAHQAALAAATKDACELAQWHDKARRKAEREHIRVNEELVKELVVAKSDLVAWKKETDLWAEKCTRLSQDLELKCGLLAAEREKYNQTMAVLDECSKELAAEREKVARLFGLVDAKYYEQAKRVKDK